ncbi:energy transducer TonB family protein [Sphingomonas sp. Tas61C01]|uniref:energy transducer TonB family protein n=1 Tax=Sphingomonas sp. Tas61C01 TaxID=3458297 RepID=UPI00403E8723
MRKVMSFVFVVITALLSTPAAPKDKSIVVVAAPTRSQWIKQIGRNLDKAIRYPHPVFGHDSRGLVSVAFVADGAGSPTVIQLVRPSPYAELNKAALQGVARMKNTYPKPTDVAERQRVRADIVFATSVDDYEAQIDAMRREAAGRTVRSALDRDTIVLNVIGHASGGSAATAR